MRTVGIEIFYWLDNWSDNQIACFHRARQAGFDAVEISLTGGPDVDIDAMRTELDRQQLRVFCSMGLPLEKDITSDDPQTRQSGVDYLKRCAEAAAKMGSPILGGLPYVPWLHFPKGVDLRPYAERSAAAMREVASTAGDLGITICTEVINRYETFIFNTVADGVRYLTMVDHPAVKLELDTYHMSMEEDNLADAVREAGRQIGHFHCAASNRKLPGPGNIDWDAIKQALDEVHYDGGLVIETFPNPDTEAGRTVNTWRKLVHDPDAEIRRSLDYLRQHVA